MKDKNGIDVECQNCASVDLCKDSFVCEQCPCQNGAFSLRTPYWTPPKLLPHHGERAIFNNQKSC